MLCFAHNLISLQANARSHWSKARKWAKIKDAARECMTASKSSATLHQATSSPQTVDARGSLFEEDSETEW